MTCTLVLKSKISFTLIFSRLKKVSKGFKCWEINRNFLLMIIKQEYIAEINCLYSLLCSHLLFQQTFNVYSLLPFLCMDIWVS